MTDQHPRVDSSATKPGYLLVVPWDLGGIGGVVQVVKNLYRELEAAGWAPTVLVTTWDATAPRQDTSGGISVLRWRVRSPMVSENPVKGWLAYLAALPATVWTWRRLAQRHGWQVVNFHFPGFGVLTWIVMKRLRLWRGLIVLSVHGKDVRGVMAASRPRRRLMRWILERVDAIVGCSSELSLDVAALAPRAGDKISVVPNGVNGAVLRAQASREIQVPDALSTRRFILNVATFEHKKAQDVLIEAFGRVAPTHTDVDLVLVGRSVSQPWLEQLRRQIELTGTTPRVHVLCDVPHADIPALLSRATVFCLPSRAEGHPVALLEAAAFGLPVVATPVGGIPQTIAHEQDGLLVPVGDAAALAEALDRVLSNRSLAETLGRSLRRRIDTEFTWKRAARRYTDLVNVFLRDLS